MNNQNQLSLLYINLIILTMADNVNGQEGF